MYTIAKLFHRQCNTHMQNQGGRGKSPPSFFYMKLNVANRSEAIAYALQKKIV